jgi:phosphoglycolate phosphatase
LTGAEPDAGRPVIAGGDEHSPGRPVAILFDVDETLISTGGAGAKSWRWAFRTMWDVDADITLYTKGGMTDPVVGRTTFRGVMGREPSDREMARLLGAYLQRLPQEVKESTGYHVLPGVGELLPRLVHEGILLGITSGALQAGAHAKLARAKLNRYFSFGGYGSDSTDRGELTKRALERAGQIHGHPIDPKDVYVVGDTPLDISAAHAAEAVAVGVATGKYSEDELRAAGADIVLATLLDPMPGT